MRRALVVLFLSLLVAAPLRGQALPLAGLDDVIATSPRIT